MKQKSRNEKTRRWRARRARTTRSVVRADRPRVTVFRSAKHIYAQLIDPIDGRTIGTVSTRTAAIAGEGATGNVQAARNVGVALAELAKEKKIERVVFNRNGFLYHGRVRALAEAAREAGLNFYARPREERGSSTSVAIGVVTIAELGRFRHVEATQSERFRAGRPGRPHQSRCQGGEGRPPLQLQRIGGGR
jgi:large subunit ribosomal protein L18